MTPIERLERLKAVFLTIPVDKIRMGTFTSDCGTAHCLAGWGAVDPVLVADGMPNVNSEDYWSDRLPWWQGGCWSDLEKFFGLTEYDANNLFGGELDYNSLVKPSDVIDNLDRAIAGQPTKKYNNHDDD